MILIPLIPIYYILYPSFVYLKISGTENNEMKVKKANIKLWNKKGSKSFKLDSSKFSKAGLPEFNSIVSEKLQKILGVEFDQYGAPAHKQKDMVKIPNSRLLRPSRSLLSRVKYFKFRSVNHSVDGIDQNWGDEYTLCPNKLPKLRYSSHSKSLKR